ncbi:MULTISPECIES: OmpP1/FadL family transporter [Acinetobacter]|jgi:long-subunit fatty acid transport protein|uniref:putative pilus system OmpP1/FadL family transporter FilD n=1 Tax=Acinetobacter TaxID=469 RepID=UPI000575CA66|nr:MULTISPECIES: outer membrane protein transport protein [Acinetobacter]ATZ64980.1 long-chain fatty acid ABC transporter [Acinetobacter bereziniae]KKW77039.1 long-chain fatty acid ABC transporter [Acinetobacter sp. Ag2]MBI0395402.1 outer membrane protein transport protein [Acinetobacter bereziniae]MCM8511651.1 outer membrane protein transport protein [Acinetobacter bereziniae]MCU4436592.1 outer membrane protein transport protein [Acinetobacter bereziniae]
MKNIRLRPLVTAILLTGCSTQVFAHLGLNLSVDIRSLTMGNAVTADPPGISAIHFNPAGLTKLKGLQTDVQGIIANFDVQREFSAPPGYNVFGYSDDPLICNDAPDNPSSLCTDYKDSVRGDVEYASLYIPILKKVVDLGPGWPVLAPTGGVSYNPPGSKLTYATAAYAPMVAGFGSEDKNPGNFMGQQVAIERITYLSPSVAYQVNDQLSLGASIGMSYNAMALKTDLRFPNEMIGVLRMVDESVCGPFRNNSNMITDLLLFGICNANEGMNPFGQFGKMQVSLEQSLSPSYNLGLMWEPTENFGFGMVYQSSAKMRMKGKYFIDNANAPRELIKGLNSSATGQILAAILGFPGYIPPTESGLIAMDLEYPAHFQAGIKYKVLPDLQVNFDVGWTDFKAWEKFQFEFDRQISALKIAKLLSNQVTDTSLAFPLGFKSPWSWGIGVEYSANDRLKLRAGYEPRASAIPDDKRNTMVPINNAQLFGLGLGYRFDEDTDIDLSVGFLRSRDNIPANTSSLANKTGVDNLLLNPYAGLNVKTNTKVTILGINYRTRW